ncbi:pilus assembly protein TadG-related protein [Thermomonospora umbrina]|uniref:Flp pilus assembly protein TadG n=1 Tax=Thermomonospora umbrina TaxID=111806 RepID=A0A3D9SLK5_9ACTN|nr:pilus assembly protein TadG-related protein [Thermomonospora umbrina]REE96812.1 Flp pilus assembly protein TadG [Thermomonospora umbrina]
MSGLRPSFARRRRCRGEEGAVQVLFGLLVACGMLLAMFAVVVDGGRIYIEHSELRGGADAAATAVARSCAEGACDVSTGADGVARRLAVGNARDGAAAVARICGRGPGLAPCPASGGERLTSCSGPPPATGVYVEVVTETRLPDGTTVLPPVVAGSVFGTYDGTRVTACARATWGGARQVDEVYPFMISECAWERATANGKEYTEPPSPTWDPPDSEEDVIFGRSTDCDHPPSIEGDFAVLPGSSWDCSVPMATGERLIAVPGHKLLSGLLALACQLGSIVDFIPRALPGSRILPEVVHVPIYDDDVEVIDGPIKQYRYTVLGFAAFEPTALSFLWLPLPSWRTLLNCVLRWPCMRGFFTRQAHTGPIVPGQANYGVSAVRLSG